MRFGRSLRTLAVSTPCSRNMQSCDSHNNSEAHSQRISAAAYASRKYVAPGALAGYLQAQQAWRRLHVSGKAMEHSCSRLQSASCARSGVSSGSHTSCDTFEEKIGHTRPSVMFTHGCKAVARLFEQRHQFLSTHRHQRQAAKRQRTSCRGPGSGTGLLSLPEDVLVSYCRQHIKCPM